MPLSQKRNILIFSVIFLGILFIVGYIFFNPNFFSGGDGCPSGSGVTHKVEILNNKVLPEITNGLMCDKIEFTNKDNVTRLMAFGPHEHHVPYDGIAEQKLDQNQSFTITLVSAGSFSFHDHFHDLVIGYFNVNK